ncbi:MAG TPA: hypothetical protein VFY90_03565 [Tepidiformaceae bacterium]|nr:hypothetical protein [Tepidiformaceae bacterium]
MAGPKISKAGNGAGSPSLNGAAAAWVMMLALVAAVFVTYSRVDVGDLYHVSHGGLAGGAGRALVAVNFPVAIAALAILPIVLGRLLWAAAPGGGRRLLVLATAAASAGLCAVAAWPGVVSQSDLDAKPINLIPAVGVALALGLSIAAARTPGTKTAGVTAWFSIAGLALVGLIVFLSLPWVFAVLGFFVGDVPGLGTIFLSDEYKPAGASLPAVHLGDHHGLDAALLAISALLLMPASTEIAGRGLRRLGIALVALLFVYGMANFVEDFWGEQVVKRGWTDWHIPQMIRPELAPAWGVVLLAAAGTYMLLAEGPRWTMKRPRGASRDIHGGRLWKPH